MEFAEFKKKTIKQIEKELKQLLKEWRSEVGKIDTRLLPLVGQFIRGCEGGKMVRGMLVVLGYEIAGSKFKVQIAKLKEIYKIAAAYEIFHNGILVHDDVIDQSLTRRGRPSLYKAIGAGHYGISQAISLGDAGFFLAMKVLSESGFPAEEKNQATSWFAQTILDTAVGEMLDVAKGDALATMQLKTAKYSVAGPLVLGAILGGGSQKLIKDFMVFGENLGVAFQIRDDILGVFGSEKQTGKSVTSDIAEGKNTLLYNYALIKAGPAQRQVLGKLYGRGNQGSKGYQSVRQVFQKTGALEYARKTAHGYKSRAKKILPDLTKDPKLSKILEQLADYLVERDS